MPWVGLQCVIVVFPDHTHLPFGPCFFKLSGRVLDLRSKGCWFIVHRRHCFVFLSKTFYPLLSTGLSQENGKLRHD